MIRQRFQYPWTCLFIHTEVGSSQSDGLLVQCLMWGAPPPPYGLPYEYQLHVAASLKDITLQKVIGLVWMTFSLGLTSTYSEIMDLKVLHRLASKCGKAFEKPRKLFKPEQKSCLGNWESRSHDNRFKVQETSTWRDHQTLYMTQENDVMSPHSTPILAFNSASSDRNVRFRELYNRAVKSPYFDKPRTFSIAGITTDNHSPGITTFYIPHIIHNFFQFNFSCIYQIQWETSKFNHTKFRNAKQWIVN